VEKIKMMTIEEFTSPNLITADSEDSLSKVNDLLHSKSVRHLPITTGSKIVGIISQRDLQAVKKDDFQSLKAKDIMTKDPFTVSSQDLIHEVAFQMSDRKIGSAIVTHNDEVYGIFTTTDALNALVEIVRESI